LKKGALSLSSVGINSKTPQFLDEARETAMDVVLGRVNAQVERPQTLKFAWPIVVLPELFATRRHLAVLVGYLASVGWEVYAPDLRSTGAQPRDVAQPRMRFSDALALLEEVVAALDNDVIVIGHGMGGLLALKMAERSRIKAAVAFAPLVPGFRSPIINRAANPFTSWLRHTIKPPRGRMLFELVADADPFQREAIIKTLIPEDATAAIEVARGEIGFVRAPAAPRLIVCGDSDVFAPRDRVAQFAETIGARLVTLNGRGHWFIGGRALERAIAETQRFLVRTLGQELLLLYPDEFKHDDSNGGESNGGEDS
jgi:pimeloyl-ACP methyl ester carboxylesterase